MFELGEVVQSSASLGRLWLTARAEHLPFIVDLMSCIASSQLKELNLELWCYGPPYFTCLKKLARLLDDTERFPVLGSVSLELQGSSDGVDWKDFRNTVMEMFAPLAAREMLDLECESQVARRHSSCSLTQALSPQARPIRPHARPPRMHS
ncbi:hypothetical protein OBBRIDRAFT_799216 [Obba rivulosa]|uniref:Uncharacterized protein n=1 Tax=Obba rivulosa TaxID=1052685 RepID=A0A8E2AGY8_9APHY|nr:hypothetical protein OBBRIDRAFT_799216 [Obba rivulosa]